MESAKTLVINLVTWNSARFLPDLFESLDRQTSDDFTVTVVDNASTDGTLEWLRDHRPDVAVLRNFRNQGFARAHNQAMALALTRWAGDDASPASGTDLSRRYVLILNPDIILHQDCIQELIAFMDAHPRVDMAGPKLLRARRLPSDIGEREEIERTNVIDSTGLVLRKSRQALDRGAGEEDRGQYDAVEPFGISGAAMVLRASAIRGLMFDDEVFDEDFFAYKEDVDLSWRLRVLGRTAALAPQAVAWHYRRAKPTDRKGWLAAWKTNRARSPVLRGLSWRNQFWLVWKNDDFVNRLFCLPWIVPGYVLRFLATLTSPVLCKASLEAWLGRGRIRAKRRELMARRKASPAEMRKWFS